MHRRLKLALLAGTASTLVGLALPGAAQQAQVAQVRPNGGGGAIAPNVSANAPESIVVRAKRLIQKEKNSPSAVTELGERQIASVGVSGSPAILLRQAPSIYVYQQGLGDNAPELTVRGLRGLEIATTLDGVPTQDLLAPGNFYLANNLGGVFTLNQISGVHIYPGVAYPDKNTFGTIGGTIAYDSKRPTNDFYVDLVGSVGSFGTYKEGFEANSGRIDSPLGTGDNAVKVLLNYYNLQTQGFIDGTPNRENEMEFALDKPYDDGLSDFQATVLYNTANGLIQNEPVPLPYLLKNGYFSNYPTNLTFAQQINDYKTLILKDDTYINDYLQVGLTAFYIGNNQQLENYGDINLFTPNGVPNQLTVGGASPFINNPAGFGEAALYGPPTPGPLGVLSEIYGATALGYPVGYGGYFYGRGHTYNPLAGITPGSAQCPNSIINLSGGFGFSPCGLNDQITGSHSDTYGIQPRFTITPPDIFGIGNTIKIGGLIAKETSPTGYQYLGSTPQTPLNAAHQFGDGTGGVVREIYQLYAQDKIDLIDNTLHITPGITVEGTHSADNGGDDTFQSKVAPGFGPNGFFGPNSILNGGTGTNIDRYGPYKATKWDREYLPFINVSYDFDKVLPPLAGLSVYGSFGNSALFAPVTDFGPNTAGPPPYASIVHLYEGGVKYDTSNLLLSVDYFYQKVDRDFGFFSFQSGPQNGLTEYSSDGQRETKGFEASAVWQVTPDFQLFANASHLLAKYLTNGFAFTTVAEDQYGTAFKSDPVTGIPDWLSTFGVDYNHKNLAFDQDALDIRLTGQYTGHQFSTYDLGGNDYLTVPNYTGLAPLDFSGCPGAPPPGYKIGGNAGTCLAYTRYNQTTGATVFDPHGGISPFAVFNIDINYKLPTPQLGVVKNITFDLNVQNLFDERFFQYFYRQISPSSCGTIKSGPFVGFTANNYSCTPSFADGIPGQPFSAFFTVTARF